MLSYWCMLSAEKSALWVWISAIEGHEKWPGGWISSVLSIPMTMIARQCKYSGTCAIGLIIIICPRFPMRTWCHDYITCWMQFEFHLLFNLSSSHLPLLFLSLRNMNFTAPALGQNYESHSLELLSRMEPEMIIICLQITIEIHVPS